MSNRTLLEIQAEIAAASQRKKEAEEKNRWVIEEGKERDEEHQGWVAKRKDIKRKAEEKMASADADIKRLEAELKGLNSAATSGEVELCKLMIDVIEKKRSNEKLINKKWIKSTINVEPEVAKALEAHIPAIARSLGVEPKTTGKDAGGYCSSHLYKSLAFSALFHHFNGTCKLENVYAPDLISLLK